MNLGEYTKALVAGIVALGVSLQTAQPGGINGNEWASSVVGAIIVGTLTWAIPNSGTYAWLDNQLKIIALAKAKVQAQDPPT